MTRLSPVLDSTDLPLAELCAARLDGELFALDDCYIPIDVPEGAAQRALAIGRQWPDRLIAEQRTAAWIWGALGDPPQRHELCASHGARARTAHPRRAVVREVVIADDEWASVGTIRVTTPLRTIVDLARFSGEFDAAERELVSTLARLAQIDLLACVTVIEGRRNLPNKRLASERIRSITDGLFSSRS